MDGLLLALLFGGAFVGGFVFMRARAIAGAAIAISASVFVYGCVRDGFSTAAIYALAATLAAGGNGFLFGVLFLRDEGSE